MPDVPVELEVFYMAEYPRVRGALALYVGDAALASELAQEAFVRVCRDWARVSTMERPGAWAHRVGMNLANSWFRRRRAEQRALRRLQGGADLVDRTDLSVAPAVRDALSGLEPAERAVIVLRYFADLSVEDTAQVLGIPVGTAKTRGRRALARLREVGLGADPEEVCQ